MKKLFVLLLVVCLLASGVLGFLLGRDGTIRKTVTAAATPAPAAATPAAAASTGGLDYDAIYALHDPDEIVMTVAGHEVPWSEYFYYLYRQGQSVESYFSSMAMYGMSADWTDEADEEGHSFAEFTVDSAESIARSLAGTMSFAEENGVTLSVEDLDAIEKKVQEDIVALCGEEGTRADLDQYLEEIRLPAALYDRMNEVSVLYQNGFTALYGENGEKMSDEEALAYLEQNGYLNANHILFMTLDAETYEDLDEETKAAKREQAAAIAAELQAIEDPEARLARFAELKEQFDEDTGKTLYPNGYIFQPGEMVAEFEEAVKAQEAFQVSDPVESAYGYHVIMTLPLTPDAVLDYSSSGAEMTARSTAANEAYAAAVDAYIEALEPVYAEGFEAPDLLSFVK
ncbi:MAG: peptidylprolyl isomerase [Oscillospiraceae bacterium]|nr:peptidylprolyl isomerase [Oscillospiraceae bacterium]